MRCRPNRLRSRACAATPSPEADDLYWASLEGGDTVGVEAVAELKQEVAARRYRAATRRAMARGFVYAPASELAELTDLAELLTRIRIVDAKDVGRPSEVERAEAEALLGGVEPPPVTISQAFDVYCKEIAVGELIGKSDAQRRIWMKTKQRGVQYFINVVGDRPLAQITRQDALQYYNWWKERLIPKTGRPTLRANTANRDLGNVRKLFSAYFKHFGEENRPNPFRNLSFSETTTATVPPFENRWVRERILAPGALDGVNRQAALIVYALIETGCRPSEIANLEPDDIRLACDVPHIRIRPGKARELKTRSSIRDIPLLGVSLAAFREAPRGFPHYRDKPDLLSATLLSAFRARDLLPTEEHVIYSFRHSFEKRMLEADRLWASVYADGAPQHPSNLR